MDSFLFNFFGELLKIFLFWNSIKLKSESNNKLYETDESSGGAEGANASGALIGRAQNVN